MRAWTLLLAALLASVAVAEPNKPVTAPAKSQTWTVEDVIASETVSDFQISPNGLWAVWVKSTLDGDKDEHVSQIMRTDLKEPAHHRADPRPG